MRTQLYDPVEKVIEAVRQGEIVIVADDKNREGELDFISSGQLIEPDKINFIVSLGRGLLCAAMSKERARNIGFLRAASGVNDRFSTAWSVSFDVRKDLKTGITCQERANTIEAISGSSANLQDFAIPGHVMGLVAKDKGVLQRPGHTEACVDLMRFAGLEPVGVLCEILDTSGARAKKDTLLKLKRKYKLKSCRVEDIVFYRRKNEKLLDKTQLASLPTKYGDFSVLAYAETVPPYYEHLVLVKDLEGINKTQDIPCRVHSECLTGDVFGSKRCDCGWQLSKALEYINAQGCGILIYLKQEGRGIGLANKVRAYKFQDEGLDTVEANVALGFAADERDYWAAAQILKDLKIFDVKLLTNNIRKVKGLRMYGVDVSSNIPLEMEPHSINERYLMTKKLKLGHVLKLV